jgi:hypothetical protein
MCIHSIKPEVLDLELNWIEYTKATHVVVGFCPCGNGGVLITADNEFDAYRYCRIYKNSGFSAKVRPNIDKTFEEVSNQINEFIENGLI